MSQVVLLSEQLLLLRLEHRLLALKPLEITAAMDFVRNTTCFKSEL
jgi:hypothetical protein